ncbi:histidine kinase [Oceanobacillus bengalensis]|uniref:Histidine kinase n=1 Tax=Oceanobacillus bengalensis TaxID=1435466 RepID=A0A494YZ84_9BACI|nr:histidine kinase [Oceanobacillus bengalensis]RKQ15546.1 histidine kinase [Oceanobacillus bengalensis]
MAKLRVVFYSFAIFFILLPTSYVFITNTPIHDLYRKIMISSAILFIILGNLITIIEKQKEKKRIVGDVSIIIALFIVFISRLFL